MSTPSVPEVIEGALTSVAAPGAVVALAGVDRIEIHAVGSTTVGAAGRALRAEDWFQIGSITKPMTATLVLQLVADGTIGLDDPVVEHLPTFRLADAEPTRAVTVAHLLTHTSGIDIADDFTDTGDGDDCLERFVDDVVVGAPLLHPVGERWSYSNGGYNVLGRMLEVIGGEPWDELIRRRVFEPSGMGAATLRCPAPDHEVVPGHRDDTESGRVVIEERRLPSSTGPAGNVVTDAASLVGFARAYWDDGCLLPAELVTAATTAQTAMRAGSYGYGWMLPRPGVVLHGGATIGHTSALGVVPAAGGVVAVLANGPGAGTIVAEVQAHLFGRRPTTDPVPGDLSPEPPATDVVGTYRRRHVDVVVSFGDGGLEAQIVRHGPLLAYYEPLRPVALTSVGGGRYTSVIPGERGELDTWDFGDLDGAGRPTSLMTQRLHRRSA